MEPELAVLIGLQASGQSVVVNNTNPGPGQWAPLIALAQKYGARAVAYYFPPDVGGCLARNASRPADRRVHDGVRFTLVAEADGA